MAARPSRSERRSASRRPGRPRLGRPPGADAAATRDAILEAALEAFASHGYDAVSVRELTRDLGVSHNLVRHYFGSKRDLWQAVVDDAVGERIGEVVARLERRLEEDGDPFASLADSVREVVTLFARLPALPRLLLLEASTEGERLDYLYARHLERFFRVVDALRKRILTAGGRRVDGRSLALVLLTASGAPFTHEALARRLGGPAPTAPAAIRRHAETVAALVIDGLRPGTREEPRRRG